MAVTGFRDSRTGRRLAASHSPGGSDGARPSAATGSPKTTAALPPAPAPLRARRCPCQRYGQDFPPRPQSWSQLSRAVALTGLACVDLLEYFCNMIKKNQQQQQQTPLPVKTLETPFVVGQKLHPVVTQQAAYPWAPG